MTIARFRSIGTVWVGGDLESSSGLEVAQAVTLPREGRDGVVRQAWIWGTLQAVPEHKQHG